jgi:hypothetical protein
MFWNTDRMYHSYLWKLFGSGVSILYRVFFQSTLRPKFCTHRRCVCVWQTCVLGCRVLVLWPIWFWKEEDEE